MRPTPRFFLRPRFLLILLLAMAAALAAVTTSDPAPAPAPSPTASSDGTSTDAAGSGGSGTSSGGTQASSSTDSSGSSTSAAAGQDWSREAALCAIGAKPVPAGARLAETPTSLVVTLKAEGRRVLGAQSEKGASVREGKLAEGLGSPSTGRVGEPDIAGRIVRILVPWDADLKSIRLSHNQTDMNFLGRYDIRPVGRAATYDPEKQAERLAPLPEGVTLDARGRDVAIYGADKAWPQEAVKLLGTSRLRQYRIVRVLFQPFRWNPVTRDLHEVTGLALTVSWNRLVVDQQKTILDLTDPVKLTNIGVINIMNLIWYWVGTTDIRREGSYDYVIVTTYALDRDSYFLATFVTLKESQGHSVAVVRVEGIEALYPASERADSIRDFLRDKNSEWGIDYVLLAGSPDPYDQSVGASDSVGSVPMKMAWPYGDGTNGIPTDHYYGDLSDDWDSDGDGYAADATDSGLDWDMEVKVGRVPFDDRGDLDGWIVRTWAYENASMSAVDQDRQRIYLANSFFAADTDYAHLGRQIHSEFFSSGFNVITFYQQSSASNSVYSSTYSLTDLALVHHWQSYGAGLVIWSGHGSQTSTSIGYSDSGVSYWEGTLMNTSYTNSLSEAGGSFVIQLSCQNAYPENASNLAHQMLDDTAVTTIAGTRNSWYSHEQEDFGTSWTIGDVGYWCGRSHANSWTAGYAMVSMRANLGSSSQAYDEVNRLTYNLYGDPSVRYTYQ